MASTSLTRIYDTLFSLTLDAYKDTLADNIHKAIPYLWWLENRGRGQGTRMENGGVKIQIPVVFAKNTNAQSYSKYDRLNLNPTEEITSALEDWAECATTVSVSRREMRQNSGNRAIMNLLRNKMNVAEMSLRQEINRQLVQGVVGLTGTNPTRRFENGNSNKDMLPLGALIQKDFSSMSLHSINQSTETWWQNQATLSAATTYAGLKKEMNNIYNNCTKGGTNDAPDFALCDQNYFEVYEGSLMAIQRYGNYGDDGAASAGYESLKFKGAVMLWDEFVPNPTNTATSAVSLTQVGTQAAAFFMNSKWLELVIDEETNFISTPFEEPVDQTAIYAKLLFMGQHTVTQRRKHGLHYNVTATTIVG